jgi:hypothetical protein
MRGYQLVARTPGVNVDQVRELTRRSPSHGAMLDTQTAAESMISFPLGDQQIAVGRTMHGLPEYSGRGGRQTVTQYLIVTREHLAGFENNIWNFWLVARSHGLLQWNPDYRSGLNPLPMVDHWGLGEGLVSRFTQFKCVQSAIDLLNHGRRVAVTGLDDPAAVLHSILASIPAARRLEISFSTSLRPSIERPFRLQLLPDVDLDIRVDLSSDQVAVVRNQENGIPA